MSPDTDRPLSIDQEGRLFLESWMNLRSAPYLPFHLHAGLMLAGEVDVARLEWAFNAIIRRHDVLRTAFLGVLRSRGAGAGAAGESRGAGRIERPGRSAAAGGAFRQAIVADAPLAVLLESLEHVPAAARQSEIQRVAREIVEIPFDYEKPPLLRALLLRLAPCEHALILVLHHLVGDGWSLGILAGELATLYGSPRETPAALPPLPAQFTDFATWQRARVRSGALERLAAHVGDRYRDFDSVQASCHDLPFAGPRGPIRHTACETLSLSRTVSQATRQLARHRRMSLYMVLLGALAEVVHLYTGKPRVGIWGHFANRTRPEFERLIGWFSTFRLLSVDFTADPAMQTVLDQTRSAVLEATTFQDLPFALLWEAIKGDARSGAKAPRVFGESHVSFNVVVWTRWPWPGISRMHPATFRPGGGERALRVTAVDSGADLMLFARYPREVLPPDGIRQMLADVETVLGVLVADPEARTSSLARLMAYRPNPRAHAVPVEADGPGA